MLNFMSAYLMILRLEPALDQNGKILIKFY